MIQPVIQTTHLRNRVNKLSFQAWCSTYKPVLMAPGYRGRPLVMGILNITPDSFSDGGRFVHLDDGLKQAERMLNEGADILDLGAESTRPGATPLDVGQELDRLLPMLERVRGLSDVLLSVDTYKPEVMQAAVHAGAGMINDVFALQKEGAVEMLAKLNVPVCLMHMQGAPQTMQHTLNSTENVVESIQAFFHARVNVCVAAGIARERLVLDPGFGFGKTVEQNLRMTKQLSVFQSHGLPLLLGVSRKSTLGAVLQQDVMHRMPGALGASVFAAMQGVGVIRTHDVAATKQALDMLDAIERGE
jgi:dihydropteroate synthase